MLDLKREIKELVATLAEKLLSQSKTLAVAESCTGGFLAKELTELAGSSGWFLGGVVSYSNDAKQNLLGVDANLLDEFGAVSQSVAEAMAVNTQCIFTSSIAVSITGIAGPSGGTMSKPVGLVWFALKTGDKLVDSSCITFQGSREMVRLQAVHYALTYLIQTIEA